MLNDIISKFLSGVPIDRVMSYVERLTTYDRYQASLGIEDAASFVADTARSIGLEEVSVERTPADGTARWWSFRAPVAWTPLVARLEIRNGHSLVFELDHCRQPFSIATYSAPTGSEGVVAPLRSVGNSHDQPNLRGSIAVIDRLEFNHREQITRLSSEGAIGFVTDAASCSGSEELEHTGRIELDPSSQMFAFSLTSRQFDAVKRLADLGAQAKVVIDIDRSAMMPLVTALLPGTEAEEVWMIAHLCHPRPGANDNASGVAALLGAGFAMVGRRQAERRRDQRKTIRFIWGPEFLGTAAMLHNRMNALGKGGLPAAVIDLDMVGENQELCGGPFTVERSPDFHTTLINPLAEHIVSQVFDQTSNKPGTWKAVPFRGFSDHALFADPNIGASAVQLCHTPDRFNHSSGDSLDKVSEVEMLRATAVAGTLAHILTHKGSLSITASKAIVEDWCKRERAEASRTAWQYRYVEGGEWGRRLVEYTDERNAALLSLPEITSGGLTDLGESVATSPKQSPVMGQWSGPFNTRAMLADLPKETHSAMTDLIRSNKRYLSLLLNFAVRANGQRTRSEVISETSMALREPLDERTAAFLFNALIESGWVKEVSMVGAFA